VSIVGIYYKNSSSHFTLKSEQFFPPKPSGSDGQGGRQDPDDGVADEFGAFNQLPVINSMEIIYMKLNLFPIFSE